MNAPTGGPGDLVKIILDKLGIKPKSNCGCEAMRQRMNEWGWRGCWTHRDEISDWFKRKAAEARIEITATELRNLSEARYGSDGNFGRRTGSSV